MAFPSLGQAMNEFIIYLRFEYKLNDKIIILQNIVYEMKSMRVKQHEYSTKNIQSQNKIGNT